MSAGAQAQDGTGLQPAFLVSERTRRYGTPPQPPPGMQPGRRVRAKAKTSARQSARLRIRAVIRFTVATPEAVCRLKCLRPLRHTVILPQC